MANSISKIYIEGRTYDINATLNGDDYKVVIFQSEETFIQKLTDLSPGNFCFVVKDGELLLCEITTYETAPDDGITKGSYTYRKMDDLKKSWRQFQITNLINSKMTQINELFTKILTAAESYEASLADIAAGAVKIFPTLQTFLSNYQTTSQDVTTKTAAGTYIITLGRYNINDGGGATYYVTDDVAAISQQDSCFIYELSEGRSLVLLYDEYLNFAQLGGKGNDTSAAAENTRILQRFCAINGEMGLTLKFGNKTYFFNPTILNGNNFSIEGTSANTNLDLSVNDGKGTIIALVQNSTSDSFLWSIGGRNASTSYFSNITLKNLTFTGAKAANNKVSFSTGTYLLPSLVHIGLVQKSYFENLSFNGFQGCGLTLQTVYASSFENLKFWHGYCLDNRNSSDASLRYAAMTFGSELAQETSDIHFGNIMFKQIVGSHMLFETGSNVNSVHFDSVFSDAGSVANNTEGKTIWSNVTYDSMSNLNTGNSTVIGAIVIGSKSTTKNVVFKTFSGRHYGSYALNVNGAKYLLKTFLYFETPGESIGPTGFDMHFEHIIHTDNIDEVLLGVYSGSDQQSPKDFMLEVTNLTTDNNGPILFTPTGVPRVKLCHLGPNCLNNLKTTYQSFIDYFKQDLPTKSETNGVVVPAIVAYQGDAFAENHLVGRLINTSFNPGTSNDSFGAYSWASFIPIAGNTCRIRYKSSNEVYYGFYSLITRLTDKDEEHYKLESTNGAWKWADINVSGKSGDLAIVFYSKSANTRNDFLDVFYFK